MPAFLSPPQLPFSLSVSPRHPQSSPSCSAGRPILKNLFAASVAVGAIVFAFPFVAPVSSESSSSNHVLEVRGHPRVVDADTFVFQTPSGTRRVRLLALDAFEMRQSCTTSSGSEYRCGDVARKAMQRLIGKGEVVCSGAKDDMFGRLVGVCVNRDGADVGKELVRQGWALAFTRYGRQYTGAMNEAESKKSGAWEGKFLEPWEFRKLARKHYTKVSN